MSLLQYILKSFLHFRKQHLAVLAGTIISTAVLTGALIVGDSVKYSLKQIVDTRLGKTEFALQAGERYVRTELAQAISDDLQVPASPLLHLNCIAINSESDLRINKVQIYGIQPNFWNLSDLKLSDLNDNEIYISENLASKLNLNIHDEVLLRVENSNVIPLNTPFNKETSPSVSFRVTVKNILSTKNLGRFGLKNIQTSPLNIFISHTFLAEKLELKGLSNVIITSNNVDKSLNSNELNQALKNTWQLKDANLIIRELDDSYELLSSRIFIDEPISKTINSLDIPQEKILTYMVNSIRSKHKETPYSFVTAASNSFLKQPLAKNEIIVNQWLANDLEVNRMDTIELEYFIIGPLKTLEEKTSKFIIKDIIPTHGKLANSSLMPLFPGLADAGSCNEWEAGIPIDLDRIRDKDEKYWDNYKGTPKAFISIDQGIDLWANKYGNYTSIRFDKKNTTEEYLSKEILRNLNPNDLKLSFNSIRSNGIQAASNGVDFGELFLSMSFFVIAAGILLTILIYSLNIESRSEETGILSGLGFTRKQIVKIKFAENIITIILGGIIGSLLGILYNKGVLFSLNSVWNDIVRTNMISVFIFPKTILTGALTGIIIALGSIYFVTRKKLKQSTIGIIRSDSVVKANYKKRRYRLNLIISITSLLLVASILIYSFYSSVDQNAGLILSAGGLFLIACVLLVNIKLSSNKSQTDSHLTTISQLAFKNAGKNKLRSISIVALLALGTFTIIITGANRKTFYGSENSNQSGTGGFLFWAETTLPVLYNLNTDEGKTKLGLNNEKILDSVEFVQLHQLDGDDASCLNLNQIQNPQILGLNPEELNKRESFSFIKLRDNINNENPWLELNKSYGENIIPAYADQTVITWGLIKEVGDTLIYLDEKGEELKIILIGGLNASIFQGNIIIANKHFTKHFPSVSGSKTMLIDGESENKNEIAEVLNTYLRNYGIELTATSERLSQFYSITNTYLTIFMFLGGLGIIIGTFGLGIVLLRNIIERKSEVALLLSVGYSKKKIVKLILIENLYLLITGIVIGILSAFIGILPSILSPSFDIPGYFMIILVIIVFVSGFIWIYFPTKKALKTNLISSLRNE